MFVNKHIFSRMSFRINLNVETFAKSKHLWCLSKNTLRPVRTKRGLTKPGLSLKPGFTKPDLNLDLKVMHQIFKTRFS